MEVQREPIVNALSSLNNLRKYTNPYQLLESYLLLQGDLIKPLKG